MYKNATYKEKFAELREWIPYLIESIKKDLKNDHLKKDIYFVKKFLANKNIHKATTQELGKAYQDAIQEEEKGEELGEFMASRWLLKNTELYEFFEKQLSQISSDFTNLEEINPKQAHVLIDAAIHQFGAPRTYLFSVLNSVVFPSESFHFLRDRAKQQYESQERETQEIEEHSSQEQLQQKFKREIDKLTDKYEKKLSGLQKKYITDVESLKKQISLLQRKLHLEKKM